MMEPAPIGVTDEPSQSTVEKLRRSEQRLMLALSAGRLGSWEFDLAPRHLTSSAQCKANHGFLPDADMQLEADILPSIDEDHRDRFREAIEDATTSQGSFEIEVPLQWPDGSHHWLLVAGRVIDPTCMVGVSVDVTERRRIEQELREAERRKDEFLAVLAHELRNPLAPILTAARLLQLKGSAEPELQKLRDTIIRQTSQLTTLVDDLLDVGRITAGKLQLNRSRVDVNGLLRQAVETCLPLIERRRHTLAVAFTRAPVYLDVDPARIVQVLCNLLNNAAKYSREGGRIDLSAVPEGHDVVIRVRDEGVGIERQMLQRIFDRFVQVGTSQHRADGGLGIGLSLVKALVDLHGGHVEAHSEGVGKGSEFVVRLPGVE